MSCFSQRVPWVYDGTTCTLALPHTRIVYTIVKVPHPHWTDGLIAYEGICMWQIWLQDRRGDTNMLQDDSGDTSSSRTCLGASERLGGALKDSAHTRNGLVTVTGRAPGHADVQSDAQIVPEKHTSPEGFQAPTQGIGIMTLYRGNDPVKGWVLWATPTRWEAKALILRDIVTFRVYTGGNWGPYGIRIPLHPPHWVPSPKKKSTS